MNKGRLEAFSDGVLAIIITIMVLELKVPSGSDLEALRPVLPIFLSYILSFVYIGIYWNNHHHLLQATRKINGRIMWANLHLLFWLSLVPATTAWLGGNPEAPWPTVLYGLLLLMASIAYLVLVRSIVAYEGKDSMLAKAVGVDVKGIVSSLTYLLALLLAFVRPWLSDVLYALVALLWLVPDSRIEKQVASHT